MFLLKSKLNPTLIIIIIEIIINNNNRIITTEKKSFGTVYDSQSDIEKKSYDSYDFNHILLKIF